MFFFPNLPKIRNAPSPSCSEARSAASTFHKVNMLLHASKPLSKEILNSKTQSKSTTNSFCPLMAPNHAASKPSSHVTSSSGVHVFSLPIRRIRGLSAVLNKLNSCEYIIETVGRILEDCEQETPSSNPCSTTFRLEEQVERARGVQLKCSFVDMDGIQPDIYYDCIYRCVGKYAVSRGVFQCYSVTPCDDTDLQLQKIFQMYSDNVIAQMLSRS